MTQDTSLTISKVIKAPRAKVFAAWTKPEVMRRWYAPGAMIVPSATADLKVGGAYAVEMDGERGGKHMNCTASGTYRKIVRDELLSFTLSWDAGATPETLVTVTFTDVPGGTEVTLKHERFPDLGARDRHMEGWAGCLVNLAKALDGK